MPGSVQQQHYYVESESYHYPQRTAQSPLIMFVEHAMRPLDPVLPRAADFTSFSYVKLLQISSYVAARTCSCRVSMKTKKRTSQPVAPTEGQRAPAVFVLRP
jgi:hypothetical protein